MKTLSIALLCCLLCSRAFGAIAFDAQASVGATTPDASKHVDLSITVGSGDNRALYLFIWHAAGGGASYLSSVTYNGSAMALVDSTGTYHYLYFIAAPASGTNTIRVTTVSTSYQVALLAASYSGASQSSPANIIKGALTQTSPFTRTLSVADNSWFAGAWWHGGYTLSAGAGTTKRTTHLYSAWTDKNGPTTPAGDASLQVTEGGGSTTITYILFEIELPAATTVVRRRIL